LVFKYFEKKKKEKNGGQLGNLVRGETVWIVEVRDEGCQGRRNERLADE